MRGYLLIALSAAGFGLMPVLAVFAYEDGVTVPTLLGLRFAIAAAVLLTVVFVRARRTGARFLPSRQAMVQLFLLGCVLYTAQSALYFSSVRYVSPALAALLLYSYPGLVAGAAAVLARTRPTALTVVSLVVSFVGVALALGDVTSDLDPAGVVLALGAAVVYTTYILYGGRVGGELDGLTMAAYISLFAAASFLVFGAVTGGLGLGFGGQGWTAVLGVAFASTVVAVLCFFLGMAILGPTKAAIGSMLEPVVSISASAALLGSGLASVQLVGAALVLIGATAGVLARGRQEDTEDGTPRPVPERVRGRT